MANNNYSDCPIGQKMEINMARIEEKLSNISEKLDDNTEQHKQLFNMIENLDKRYCPKYIEKVFITMITSLIALFIGGLFYLLTGIK